MEQVRDILFGAQLKDLETRFQRQEERFTREINDARDALKKRLDSLENFMTSENASLLNRIKEEGAERDSAIKGEQRERADAFAQMAKDMAAAAEGFERKLTKLTGMLDDTERELRRLLLSESGSLGDKVEEKYEDALNVIAGTASQIRQDMVYRSAMAGMFHDVAVRLSSQWSGELGQLMPGESGAEPARKGRNAKTGEAAGASDA